MEEKQVERRQAVVIGTGFGGAVAACRLSQAGFDPLILERGRRYEKHDFPALPNPESLLPDFGRWTWGHDQGLWDIEDLEEVIAIQAAGYGGGSLIYANVHLRPPKEVFDSRWPQDYRGGEMLDPYFNLAAWMLDAKPIQNARGDMLLPGEVPPKAIRLQRASEKLRKSPDCASTFFYPPLAIAYESGPNRHGVPQSPCVSCGACCTGCPHGAKSTLDLNYLALAEKHGAVVRTECEVEKFFKRGEVWVVEYVDHLSAEKLQVETPYLFVCAGAVHSTRLLAEWQAALPPDEQDKQLRANLGLCYFPNADALGMVFETHERACPSQGPAITTATVHGQAAGQPSWFLIQDGGYASELNRLLGALRASVWMGRNRYKGAPSPPAKRAWWTRKRKPSEDDKGKLRSPVDQLLDAMAGGMWRTFLPAQIAQNLDHLRNDLAHPLLPPIVRQTLTHAVERVLERCWLTGWLRGTPLFRAMVWFGRWVALFLMGGAEKVGEDALQAIVEGAGLSPEEIASRVLGYTAEDSDKRLMLLAMGRDLVPGRLHYDPLARRLYADMDLYHLAPLYALEERAMRDVAKTIGGELRVNPAWAFLGKPITVHSQGGCRMDDKPKDGVTDGKGNVHGQEGLYVLDGAILCTSVGVNPSATIAAVAERNIDEFLKKVRGDPWSSDYTRQRADADAWFAAHKDEWAFTPPPLPAGSCATPESEPIGLAFTEVMTGFCSKVDDNPCLDDNACRVAESKGRPDSPIRMELTASVQNLSAFFEDIDHRLDLRGTVSVQLPGASKSDDGYAVEGSLCLMVPGDRPVRQKAYGLNENNREEANAIRTQSRIAGVDYSTSVSKHPFVLGAPAQGFLPKEAPVQTPEQRFMFYDLAFTDRSSPPKTWRLQGYKRLRDTPKLHAWRDTTWLFVHLFDDTGTSHFAGVAHVDLPGFMKQMESFRVFASSTPPGPAMAEAGVGPGPVPPELRDPALDDPERVAWMVAAFIGFFFGNLQRIYMPGLGGVLGTFGRLPSRRGS